MEYKKQEFVIDACTGIGIPVQAGQRVVVVDLAGGQVVDFFAECAENEREFLSTGVTIDCNESLRLHIGDHLYSNLYRGRMTTSAKPMAAKTRPQSTVLQKGVRALIRF